MRIQGCPLKCPMQSRPSHYSSLIHVQEVSRKVTSPEPEILRKKETCSVITWTANERAQRPQLRHDLEDIPWPDSESVSETSVSSIISVPSRKSKSVSNMSRQSSRNSLQGRAAAEVAATQKVIQIMKTTLI